MKKRLAAIGVSIGILVMAYVPVCAYYVCDVCGKGNVFTHVTYGDWYSTGREVQCSHDPKVKDTVYERTYTKWEKCEYCGIGYDMGGGTETKAVHPGEEP